MKTSLTIFVVVTTLVMILRGSQSQIQLPNRPTARPRPSGETNSGGSRMTATENFMITAGPNGQEVPYKMMLQMQPSQAKNSTEELKPEGILFRNLRNAFMAGMRNVSFPPMTANSSKPPMEFMLQLEPETTYLEDTLVLNLLTLTVKGDVNLDTFDLLQMTSQRASIA